MANFLHVHRAFCIAPASFAVSNGEMAFRTKGREILWLFVTESLVGSVMDRQNHLWGCSVAQAAAMIRPSQLLQTRWVPAPQAAPNILLIRMVHHIRPFWL